MAYAQSVDEFGNLNDPYIPPWPPPPTPDPERQVGPGVTNPGGIPPMDRSPNDGGPYGGGYGDGPWKDWPPYGSGPAGNTNPGGPPPLDLADPASRAAFIKYYGSLPGADPSLLNDPGYWDGKMASGEFGSDPNYIAQKMQTAWKGSGSTGSGESLSASQVAVPSSVSDNINTVGAIVNTIPPNFYEAPPAFDYPDYAPREFNAPEFNAPAPFDYPDYALPTGAEVLAQDPGYDFRMAQGDRAIKNNASAAGILKSGQTVKALMDYAQGLGAQEYGAAEGRKFNTWQANRAGNAQDYDSLWRNLLADYGVKYGAAADTQTRALSTYDTNFRNAAAKQGFALDTAAGAAGGKQGATSLAGNLALGAGNLGVSAGSLGLNQQNSNFGNLLSLYQLSTANLPRYTPTPVANYGYPLA